MNLCKPLTPDFLVVVFRQQSQADKICWIVNAICNGLLHNLSYLLEFELSTTYGSW